MKTIISLMLIVLVSIAMLSCSNKTSDERSSTPGGEGGAELTSTNDTPSLESRTPSPNATARPAAVTPTTSNPVQAVTETPVPAWVTYTNARYQYSIQYPSEWTPAEYTSPVGADFETQSVRLSKGADYVLVAVNFQGGWCESAKTQSRDNIVVSGIAGIEIACYREGQTEPYQLVRHFAGAKGKINYTVIGEGTASIMPMIKRIVRSFEFTK